MTKSDVIFEFYESDRILYEPKYSNELNRLVSNIIKVEYGLEAGTIIKCIITDYKTLATFMLKCLECNIRFLIKFTKDYSDTEKNNERITFHGFKIKTARQISNLKDEDLVYYVELSQQ